MYITGIGIVETGSDLIAVTSTYQLPLEEVCSALRGPEGSTVTIRVSRDPNLCHDNAFLCFRREYLPSKLDNTHNVAKSFSVEHIASEWTQSFTEYPFDNSLCNVTSSPTGTNKSMPDDTSHMLSENILFSKMDYLSPSNCYTIFSIPNSRLDKLPEWSLSNWHEGEQFPLSINDVIRIAYDDIVRRHGSDTKIETLESIELYKSQSASKKDSFFFVVTFGPLPHMYSVVLLDGAAVSPGDNVGNM